MPDFTKSFRPSINNLSSKLSGKFPGIRTFSGDIGNKVVTGETVSPKTVENSGQIEYLAN